ncbi:hypothetical protein [Nocardia rhizosphaerihabitans]|uniref:hypothetical protein n=1 Tax=Nocardia rhizosphaerihabitans TaxID=1691570 RepID=UPI001669539F|nr:hypothetical protein [Nocardia rhizosphaerihabitans]
MSLRLRQRHAQPPDPSPISIAPTPQPATRPALSWPESFLAATIVVAGFVYHYLLVARGTDPLLAVQYLMAIAVPLVGLVLPSTVLGGAARAVCRLLGALFNSLGSGGVR